MWDYKTRVSWSVQESQTSQEARKTYSIGYERVGEITLLAPYARMGTIDDPLLTF